MVSEVTIAATFGGYNLRGGGVKSALCLDRIMITRLHKHEWSCTIKMCAYLLYVNYT